MAEDIALQVAADQNLPKWDPEAALESLKLDGEGPIWLQIKRMIARPILSGEWRPGERIPAELALTEHFGIARMTVARAIQSLASEGLVQRRRKVGTIVAARAQERPVFEIWDTADLVERSGGVYGYRLIECALLGDDEERRARLGVGRDAQALWVRCLHLSDGHPFQLEERLINVDAAPGISCQVLENTAPSPWLLEHVPWSQAEHAIIACEADKSVAAALDTPVGAACLVVERRTWNGEVPVTVARMWQDGSRHRLIGQFEPSR